MRMDRTAEVVVFRRFNVPLLLIAAGAAALIVSIVVLVTGFNPPDADVKFDWLVTREAVRSGGNAHADVVDLADRYGVEILVNADPSIGTARRHPRTPGALFLQLPLTLISFDLLFAGVSFVSICCIAWLATVRPGGSLHSRVLLLAAFAVAPTFQTLRFGGQAALIGVAALSGWLQVRRGRVSLGGALIGLAAVFKLFPLILLLPLAAYREKKAVLAALVAFSAANLIGLGMPGVSSSGVFEGLADAAELYRSLFSNGSIFRIMDLMGLSSTAASGAVALLLVISCLLLLRRSSAGDAPFGWLAAALLVLPLSWGSFDLILIPAVTSMIAGTRSKALRIIGIGVAVLWFAPILVPGLLTQSGLFSLLARVLVLGTAIRSGVGTFGGWSLLSSPPPENRHSGRLAANPMNERGKQLSL